MSALSVEGAKLNSLTGSTATGTAREPKVCPQEQFAVGRVKGTRNITAAASDTALALSEADFGKLLIIDSTATTADYTVTLPAVNLSVGAKIDLFLVWDAGYQIVVSGPAATTARFCITSMAHVPSSNAVAQTATFNAVSDGTASLCCICNGTVWYVSGVLGSATGTITVA
jgi:hypothetical protein